MFDRIFKTSNSPRFSRPSREISTQDSVRVVRLSREDVSLQIRLKSGYVTVALTFEECREIGQALIDSVTYGRIKYRIVDASAAGKPCFEIRRDDDNFLSCYAATHDEAVKYAEGTLRGVVVP